MITSKSNYFSGIPFIPLKFFIQNERKILKMVLLGYLYQLFNELVSEKTEIDLNHVLLEYHVMDSKIIQFLIQGILETEEYTLEGIARYTHIPLDVIYDAAAGINNQFSITLWVRIIDLYMQVKPEIAILLIEKLLALEDKYGTFSIKEINTIQTSRLYWHELKEKIHEQS